MWDTIVWESIKSDEGFQFDCVSVLSGQLGYHPVALEEDAEEYPS